MKIDGKLFVDVNFIKNIYMKNLVEIKNIMNYYTYKMILYNNLNKNKIE